MKKQNNEDKTKKPKLNKYQIASKIGEVGKQYVVPAFAFVGGVILTAATGKFINNKE